MKYVIGFAIGVLLTYGLLFTFDRIKGNTDSVYVDTPCPKCIECMPFAKIINPASVICDCRDYKLLIEEMNNQIKCYQDKWAGWMPSGCN